MLQASTSQRRSTKAAPKPADAISQRGSARKIIPRTVPDLTPRHIGPQPASGDRSKGLDNVSNHHGVHATAITKVTWPSAVWPINFGDPENTIPANSADDRDSPSALARRYMPQPAHPMCSQTMTLNAATVGHTIVGHSGGYHSPARGSPTVGMPERTVGFHSGS